jgi:uncharacterized membrane protein
MSDSKNFPQHLLSFVHQLPRDPAKKVSYLYEKPAVYLSLTALCLLRTSYQNLKTICCLVFLAGSLMATSMNTQMQIAALSESLEITSTLRKFYVSTTLLMTCDATKIQ